MVKNKRTRFGYTFKKLSDIMAKVTISGLFASRHQFRAITYLNTLKLFALESKQKYLEILAFASGLMPRLFRIFLQRIDIKSDLGLK